MKNQEIRSRRLLTMLKKTPAEVQMTQTGDILILEFKGLRNIKCDRSLMRVWLENQWVETKAISNGFVIKLSSLGEKYLGRTASGEIADQHRDMATATIKINNTLQAVCQNINESPLSAMFKGTKARAAWLSSEEFSAGERIRIDFEMAHMSPKITASWDPNANLGNQKGGRRPTDTISDRAISARKRLNDAIDAMGPELSGVVIDVCCFLKGLEEIEHSRQWPRRSAKLLLKAGLSALFRYYEPHRKPVDKSSIRQWGASDYRPEMHT